MHMLDRRGDSPRFTECPPDAMGEAKVRNFVSALAVLFRLARAYPDRIAPSNIFDISSGRRYQLPYERLKRI